MDGGAPVRVARPSASTAVPAVVPSGEDSFHFLPCAASHDIDIPVAETATSIWTSFRQMWSAAHTDAANDIVPANCPRRYRPRERLVMQQFESVDTYEAESTLYKDYLEIRSHEPRWFMWVFVFGLGISTSILSLLVMSGLHSLNAIRYELLAFGLRGFSFRDDHRYDNGTKSIDVWAMLQGRNVGLYGLAYPRHYGKGYFMLLLFSITTSAAASLLIFHTPESVGVGVPELKAYLNGVDFPMLRRARVLFVKVLAVVLTVASGICTGHYGPLMLTGAMLGAQALQRRRWIRAHNVNFISFFRNPLDQRTIIVIGAAAGIASAFCVTVGGLLMILELISSVFPVRFALYVFAACLISTLATQVYLSYWVVLDTRYHPAGAMKNGELLAEAILLFRTHLPFGEHASTNLFHFLPAVLIGAICGALAAILARITWFSMWARRRLMESSRSKAIRYILPVLFTLLYVSVHFWIAVSLASDGAAAVNTTSDGSSTSTDTFMDAEPTVNPMRTWGVTGREEVLPEPTTLQSTWCRAAPYAVESGRNITTIRFYGLNGFLCRRSLDAKTDAMSRLASGSSRTSAAPPPSAELEEVAMNQRDESIDVYASLAFSYADSTLQFLLSQRTADTIPWLVLLVYTVLYYVFYGVYAGISLSGDTLLPSLVTGAAVGRLVGIAVHHVALGVNVNTLQWADPAVFALFGAGSFLSATSGLTFSVGAILMETTADFRHLLPLMFSIAVARYVMSRFSHDLHSLYLEGQSVPLLDAAPYLSNYAMLDVRHVMRHPVVALPGVCSVEKVVEVLQRSSHHAFPVVSVNDATLKGTVSREQLQLLLWHLVFTSGRPSPCTYEVMGKLRDRIFYDRLEKRNPGDHLPESFRRTFQVSLYPFVDTSTFTVLNTTALPRAYEVFTTLGIRHIVVVDRRNEVVGMVTRKDITGDAMSRALEAQLKCPGRTSDVADAVAGGKQTRATRTQNVLEAAARVLEQPLHPTVAQVAEVADKSSTRQLRRKRGGAAPPSSGTAATTHLCSSFSSSNYHLLQYINASRRASELFKYPQATTAAVARPVLREGDEASERCCESVLHSGNGGDGDGEAGSNTTAT